MSKHHKKQSNHIIFMMSMHCRNTCDHVENVDLCTFVVKCWKCWFTHFLVNFFGKKFAYCVFFLTNIMSGLRSWQTDRIKFYTIGVDNFYCIVIMSKLQLLVMRLLICGISISPLWVIKYIRLPYFPSKQALLQTEVGNVSSLIDSVVDSVPTRPARTEREKSKRNFINCK